MKDTFYKFVFSHLLIAVFCFIVSFPVIVPYFNKGYFPTHDGEWAVVRLTDMYRELKDGQIPPRFSGNLNFGYGYPLFNFAYPFPYYAGMVIHALRFGFVDSIKILFGASIFISALGMFFLSRLLWKSTIAGLVSAAAYVYVPYRLVDLFIRGSLGESIAFALFPIILFFLLKTIKTEKNMYGLLLAICYGVLIQTHNIMAILFSLFLLFFTCCNGPMISKIARNRIIFFVILGIGLSSFFWLPALVEKQNILLSQIPIADRNLYFVNFSQLFFSKWGYGAPTSNSAFTYQIGFLYIIFFLTSIVVNLIKKRNKTFSNYDLEALFLIVIGGIFFFLLFKESKFIWNLPLLSEINYPWTVLGILGFVLSLLCGYIVRNKKLRYFAVLGISLSVLITLQYAKPQYFINKGDNYYLTNDATTTSSNELMPLWVKKFPSVRPSEKVQIIQGKGEIKNIESSSKKTSFIVNLQTSGVIQINTIYYPGWVLRGTTSVISYDNSEGVMQFSLEKGTHSISAVFIETFLRQFSDWISLFSIIITTVLFIRELRLFLKHKNLNI